jgi:competence protein ComEC
MSNRIFYTIGIGIMSGIFFRSFFDWGGAGVALLFLIGIVLVSAWKLRDFSHASSVLLIGIAFLASGFGAWRMHIEMQTPSVLALYEGQTVQFEARIAKEPEMRETSIHIYAEPIDINTDGEYVLVTVDRFREGAVALDYGDIISVTGILEHPEAFATDGGRTFDYPGYLRARGVHYRLERADVVRTAEGTGIMHALFGGKHAFQNTIEDIIPLPASGLGEGLLLGVKRALGEDLEHAFRTVGIIHIVVLSGYNIMVIVEWLGRVLAFFFRPRLRMIIGIAAVATFVLLVGASATAVRAGIMAGLVLVARGTGRTYKVLRALMLAGVCMLLINPFLLVHDPGFQLSFLATLGLILLLDTVERWLVWVPRFGDVRGVVASTVATQIFVLPLLLYQMGLFSVVSIPVNALVLPMVPIAMMLTFLTGIFGLLAPVFGFVFGVVDYVALTYIIKIAEAFAALPIASFAIPAFPFWVTLVAYAFLAFWVVQVMRRTSDIPTQATDELSGWTIEEETEKPAPVRSTGAGSLPFT